jgi:hypothetical protein
MSKPTPKISRDRSKLLVVIVTAGLVLALAEWGSTRWLGEPSGQAVAGPVRAENVTPVPKDPFDLPAATGEPSVWMVGNSHTYAWPGMKQGDPLRVDATGIVIDELAPRASGGGLADMLCHGRKYLSRQFRAGGIDRGTHSITDCRSFNPWEARPPRWARRRALNQPP